MKRLYPFAVVLVTFLSTLNPQLSTLFAQGTAFTFQGRLQHNGAPVNGLVEFQPTLWNAVSGGSQVAANNPATIVANVTNGLFLLPLDFGDNFPGPERWLQLELRTVIGPFTPLSPRQQLTATPYALTAVNLTGTLSASQLTGRLPTASLSGTYSAALSFNNPGNSFTGNGAGLNSLDASNLSSGTIPDARLAPNVVRTGQVWLLAATPARPQARISSARRTTSPWK